MMTNLEMTRHYLRAMNIFYKEDVSSDTGCPVIFVNFDDYKNCELYTPQPTVTGTYYNKKDGFIAWFFNFDGKLQELRSYEGMLVCTCGYVHCNHD